MDDLNKKTLLPSNFDTSDVAIRILGQTAKKAHLQVLSREVAKGNDSLKEWLSLILRIKPVFDLDLILKKDFVFSGPKLTEFEIYFAEEILIFYSKHSKDEGLLAFIESIHNEGDLLSETFEAFKEIQNFKDPNDESIIELASEKNLDYFHCELIKKLRKIESENITNIKKASHPSGKVISFYEKEHKYICDGEIFTSATSLIKKGFPEFERMKIAKAISERDKIPVEEILAKWDNITQSAIEHGNRVHRYLEASLLGVEKESEGLTNKMVEGLDRIVTVIQRDFELISPEKIVFCPDLKISGTMDLLAKRKGSDSYVILDWKSSKVIEKDNPYSKFGTGIFANIPDNNFGHYSLQLALYREILLREGYLPEGTNIECIIVHIPIAEEGRYAKHVIKDYSLVIKKLLGSI